MELKIMYYVCVENSQVVSILDYQPTVPFGVQVYVIDDIAYQQIVNQTHYFDPILRHTIPIPAQVLSEKQQQDEDNKMRQWLNSTDWMVLRHLRQKHLQVTTSLTDEQFTQLEMERHKVASRISKSSTLSAIP